MVERGPFPFWQFALLFDLNQNAVSAGTISDVERTDRLGERELALRHIARAAGFFLRVDRERRCIQARAFGGGVIDIAVYCRLHFLDVLPAQPAASNLACQTENGSDTAACSRCAQSLGKTRQPGERRHSAIDPRAVDR